MQDGDYVTSNNPQEAEGQPEDAPTTAPEDTRAEGDAEAKAEVTELETTTPGAIVEPAPSEIPPEDPDADQPYTRGTWHGLPKMTCKACGVSFLSEAEFWDHVRVHIPPEQQAEAMRVLIFGADGLPITR